MLYLVVRQTLDWGDEAAFRAQLPPTLAPTVARWNETFTMPYHLVRRELKRIAQANWARVEGAVQAPLRDVPTGALIAPSDDDDWFAPDLAQMLAAEMKGNFAACSWRSEFLEVPISLRYETNSIRRALFPEHASKWVCTTNNYAVVAHAGVEPLVADHTDASRWFVAHPERVKRLRRSASVMNRSLASRTSVAPLRSGIRSRANLVRKLERYRRLYRRPLPARLAWCAPYVAMMRDLMDEIGVR